MPRLLVRSALAIALVALAGGRAEAQIFPGPGEGTDLPDFETPVEPPDDEGDEVEAEVIADGVITQTNRSSLRTSTDAISSRTDDALDEGDGLREDDENAVLEAGRLGEAYGLQGLSVWTNVSVALVENDAGTELDFEGEVITPLVGVDYVLPGGWVVGLALGYEANRFDTSGNAGTLDSDGILVTPYVGKSVNEFFGVDAGLGYTRLFFEQTGTTNGNRGSGEFDGNRFFGFVNANGYVPASLHGVDGLAFAGRLGFRYSFETQEGGLFDGNSVDDEIELGQVTIEGEARYAFDAPAVRFAEAFFRATGTVDAILTEADPVAGVSSPSTDRTDVTLGVGTLVGVTESVSVDLTYERTLSRENIDSQTISAGLRITF